MFRIKIIVTNFSLIILFLVSCSSDKKSSIHNSELKSEQTNHFEGESLFDGKTLDGWEITSFGTQGPVYVSDGKIILNYGDGCTGITWGKAFPKINYQVSLDARKTSGNDFFCGMTFPVKDQYCSLIVGGWGGPVVGLSCIDGNDAANNDTKIMKRFDSNVWYHIQLQVSDSTITAWIDEKKLVDFNYLGRELYVRPEVELSKPFGICSWVTTAELRNIRLKKLD